MAEADSVNDKEVSKASAKMLSEVGQPGLITHNSFVNELGKKDLAVPNIYYTFDQMVQHSAIKEPLTLTTALQTNAIVGGKFESSGSRLSQALADYANYVIHNMKYMGWHQAVQNINLHVKNGFSLNEITARRATKGAYKGDLVLDYLGPRSPKSVHAWVWDKYKRRVTHVVQNPLQEAEFKIKRTSSSYLGNYYQSGMVNWKTDQFGKYPVISMDKLIHNVYDESMGNPQGSSALEAAYKPWQETQVIGEYEIIGVARNFGGVPVARVPDELLIRGNDPVKYPDDAQSLKEIQDDLESAHAGRQAFFLLPSSTDQSGKYEWDIQLLGITGGTGQFDISEIVKRKATEIYNCFNAGHLILGQNGNTTSYSAAEHGTATHATIIERDLNATSRTIERMIAQLLDAQGFEYDRRDLPVFRPAAFDQLSLDELGKFIQRCMSVSGMTEEMMAKALAWGNMPTEGLDMIDFQAAATSRAGESQGTSGTGSGKQENSNTNMENKQQAPLNWTADDMGDQVGLLDERGNLVQIIEKNK